MRILLCLVLLHFSCAALGQKACSQVVVSAHPDYPPFHWFDGDSLTGASIAVSVKIFESMGVKSVVSYEGPWKRVLLKAKAGQVDFIPALKRVQERESYLSFTDNPFYFNPVAVFVRKDETRQINALADLTMLSGSISLGDKHGEAIDTFIDAQVSMQRVYGLSANFQMLDLGRTDYFIGGFYTGRDFLHQNPLQDKIKVAKVFEDNLVHNGFSKASPCSALVHEFDQKLRELAASGYVAQMMDKYEQLWLERY